MITFIFSTFGSLIILAIYFMTTLVIGMAVMKKIAPKTYHAITTGTKPEKGPWSIPTSWFEYIMIAFIVFLFWPIVAIGYIIKFTLCLIVGPMFIYLFQAIDKITPNISIDINKK